MSIGVLEEKDNRIKELFEVACQRAEIIHELSRAKRELEAKVLHLEKEISTHLNAGRIFGEEVYRLRTLIAEWSWMDIPSRERLQAEAEKIRQERIADALEKSK